MKMPLASRTIVRHSVDRRCPTPPAVPAVSESPARRLVLINRRRSGFRSTKKVTKNGDLTFRIISINNAFIRTVAGFRSRTRMNKA